MFQPFRAKRNGIDNFDPNTPFFFKKKTQITQVENFSTKQPGLTYFTIKNNSFIRNHIWE